MSQVSKQEEALRDSGEAGWASLGRALADRGDVAALVAQAVQRRQIEQNNADRQTQFAALARQIGDAASRGRAYTNHLVSLQKLRRFELTGKREL